MTPRKGERWIGKKHREYLGNKQRRLQKDGFEKERRKTGLPEAPKELFLPPLTSVSRHLGKAWPAQKGGGKGDHQRGKVVE